jgi:hypothetical protein
MGGEVSDLLDTGASRFQHPQISEQSIEVGDASLAAEKPRDAVPVIFEQHQRNLVHGLRRSSGDVSIPPLKPSRPRSKSVSFLRSVW